MDQDNARNPYLLAWVDVDSFGRMSKRESVGPVNMNNVHTYAKQDKYGHGKCRHCNGRGYLLYDSGWTFIRMNTTEEVRADEPIYGEKGQVIGYYTPNKPDQTTIVRSPRYERAYMCDCVVKTLEKIEKAKDHHDKKTV